MKNPNANSMPRQLLSTPQSTKSKRRTPMEQIQQVVELGLDAEEKIIAIRQRAEADKANSTARENLEDFLDHREAQVNFRTRKTKPQFRRLHRAYARYKVRLVTCVEHSELKYWVWVCDCAIAKRAWKEEKEVVKEWASKRQEIIAEFSELLGGRVKRQGIRQ
ncbi:hypothetical protein B0T16DRAFT_392788 [Cercophora newfieldiana]|uniref:Uncharacterized protein n=1 Tax=Cercophora newfieldiana TaxID=92897 RepID=A0AA40CPE0_9PEZI|nr:hypothetical protein B0T16DRAFT_392788 [Cercophora newfieldiana]